MEPTSCKASKVFCLNSTENDAKYKEATLTDFGQKMRRIDLVKIRSKSKVAFKD